MPNPIKLSWYDKNKDRILEKLKERQKTDSDFRTYKSKYNANYRIGKEEYFAKASLKHKLLIKEKQNQMSKYLKKILKSNKDIILIYISYPISNSTPNQIDTNRQKCLDYVRNKFSQGKNYFIYDPTTAVQDTFNKILDDVNESDKFRLVLNDLLNAPFQYACFAGEITSSLGCLSELNVVKKLNIEYDYLGI